MTPVVLRGGGTAVVIDPTGAPAVLHWGADTGTELPGPQAFGGPVLHSNYDEPLRRPLWPSAAAGWRGIPAVSGHRDGRNFAPVFLNPRVEHADAAPASVALTAEDAECGLRLRTELELLAGGLLRIRHSLANTAAEGGFELARLAVALPVPQQAAELLDVTGRWTRERHPQRLPFQQGSWVRAGRHGRTGHDAPLLLAAGTPGFSNRRGELWAVHFGWSGNYEVFAERTADPVRMLGAAELFAPGELVLAPGASYSTPWLYAARSEDGLDGISAAFHAALRARPQHPRRPRPVVLNTWEAVYFDHDLATLKELADRAAEVGVERFVLDDGWFGHRRNDTAGLGDWWVDPAAWPDGLGPLISYVRGLGMEFGLWFEPEMVSVDSDLARQHPDWICRSRSGALPPEWRNQQVLDLTNPEAFEHILDSIDAVLRNNDIAFIKWDQNRDLTDMASGGRPSTHAQTLAAYRLFAAVKERHPGLEIESCSSGGARVDLGVLEHTDRVWASDSNDALERQSIQQWTQRVLPPELVGSHIGPPTAHTSGRTASLAFRGITALFGHFGMEWDIREARGAELDLLKELVAVYKQHRELIATGTAVRADLSDDTLQLYGVVSPDRTEALFALAALRTSYDEAPGPLGLPGLDPQRTYSVRMLELREEGAFVQRTPPAWLGAGTRASGAVLSRIGLPMPALNPERAILLRVAAV